MTSRDLETPDQPRGTAQPRVRGRKRAPGGLTPRDLRYLRNLDQARGIRIRTRCDGFGAQYMAQMSALAWAVHNNRYFYFEPFAVLDHGEDAETMSQFTGLRSWGRRVRYKRLAHVRFVPEILESAEPSRYFNSNVLSILREMYRSSPKPAPCSHQIAIHIRRGDVGEHLSSRWLSSDVYLSLVQSLQRFFPGASIGLYSQGQTSDFRDFARLGVSLELNRDLRETFHELVTAPMLFPAPSCLSYAAAVLSEGVVVHLANQQNRPLSHWLHSRALSQPPTTLRQQLAGLSAAEQAACGAAQVPRP
jgi:hypothetical protein